MQRRQRSRRPISRERQAKEEPERLLQGQQFDILYSRSGLTAAESREAASDPNWPVARGKNRPILLKKSVMGGAAFPEL